jgi:hypothetical protein
MPRFLRARASSVLGFALASARVLFCGLGFLCLIANLEQRWWVSCRSSFGKYWEKTQLHFAEEEFQQDPQ